MKPIEISEIHDRKRYSTKDSWLIAGNDYWDGHNFERSGRQTFLYRTRRGAYFAVHLTCWQGERDRIEPLTVDAAATLYESLPERRLDFEEAFPGVELVEA
jgi:hypothetical protein